MCSDYLRSPCSLEEMVDRYRSGKRRNPPKAMVYTEFLHTAGGGERSALNVGLALDRLGFQVIFSMTHDHGVVLEEVAAQFGISPGEHWELRVFDTFEELEASFHKEKIEVFVNHSFGSVIPNHALYGFYVSMFPQRYTEEHRKPLDTYDSFWCISEFTRIHLNARWGAHHQAEILYPPISEAHFQKYPVRFHEKEPLILNVGRFNVEGHNKCQLDAIEAFNALRDQNILSEEWKMIVVGRLNDSPDNAAYLDACRRAAERYGVQIAVDVPFGELTALYRRASFLWQFTGVGLPYGTMPEWCEHLGLVAMDCFAYGVIPIVYERSGVSYLIEDGVNGYTFAGMSSLEEIMQLFTAGVGSPYHRRCFKEAQRSAERFSFERYAHRIGELVGLA